MNPTKFDELTKELAKSTSRRQALRTILTASIGGVVGLGAIRSVFGAGGNSFCDQWCHALFGQTRAAGKCTSDAAHHTGLCVTCGEVAPADICCVRDSNGFCIGGTVADTCGCDSTQCQTCDATTGTCVGCPPGSTCQNGQCTCTNPGVCGTFQNCPGTPQPPGIGCFCGSTTEGSSACWSDDFCDNVPSRTSSADCPANSVCVVNTCCGAAFCFQLCSADGPSEAVHHVPTGSGPTGSHL